VSTSVTMPLSRSEHWPRNASRGGIRNCATFVITTLGSLHPGSPASPTSPLGTSPQQVPQAIAARKSVVRLKLAERCGPPLDLVLLKMEVGNMVC
jgi:hypothetical protein